MYVMSVCFVCRYVCALCYGMYVCLLYMCDMISYVCRLCMDVCDV